MTPGQIVRKFFEEVRSGNNPDYSNQLMAEKVLAHQIVSEEEQTVCRTLRRGDVCDGDRFDVLRADERSDALHRRASATDALSGRQKGVDPSGPSGWERRGQHSPGHRRYSQLDAVRREASRR